MKKSINFIVAAILLALPIISMAQNNVPYKINNNYFAKNENEVLTKKITSEAEFLRHFNPAFVNKNIESQKIDFKKQFVIVLTGEVTNRPTEYDILSVTEQNGELIVSYSIKEKDAKQSYKIKPQTILVLDMKYARMSVNYERKIVKYEPVKTEVKEVTDDIKKMGKNLNKELKEIKQDLKKKK